MRSLNFSSWWYVDKYVDKVVWRGTHMVTDLIHYESEIRQ